jgi:transcriptional regulator with XRE-family HTH domain
MMHEEEQPFPSNEDEPEPGARHSPGKSHPRPPVIGARMRAARLAAGLTQRELAGGQFSASYISALERGNVIPSFRALGKLANRLGVTISALLGESELGLSALVANRTPKEIIAEIERSEREETIGISFGRVEALLHEAQPLEALQLLGGKGDPPGRLTPFERVQWCWLASWACSLAGKPAPAIRLAQQGLELAEEVLARAPLAEKPFYKEWVERLRCYLGSAYCVSDHPGLAWFHHRQCFAAVGEGHVNDPYLKIVIYKGLGNDALALGWHENAISFYRVAQKQAEKLRFLRELGLIAWGLGVACQASGDLYRARSSFQQALQAFAALENLQMVAQARLLLGNIHVELQEYTEAEQHLRQSRERAESLKDLSAWATALNNLSALSLAKLEVRRSISLAREGLALAQQSRNQRAESGLHLTLAEAYQVARDPEATEQAFQAAIQIAKQSQNYDVMSDACEQYSKFLHAQGRFKEACQQIELTLPLLGRRA